ncbi:MAG: amino acid adenylation domain-containing protein, partial [Tumebacillaceae bacterium]
TLLAGIVEAPEQPVFALPLMTEAERDMVVVQWNDTRTDYPQDATIQQVFAEQAEATPDAVALVDGETVLTYRELNERANQVARHLQQMGVREETLVGICMDRTWERIVGLLGILKTGGAYVPLDPSYPQERLALLMEDAALTVLVAQEHLVEKLPAQAARVLCLDRDWEAIAAESCENVNLSMDAGQMANVIFTSGSTGRPKGVCVTHRGVVRLVKETNFVDITSEDVFTQYASISFDGATLEIWGALLNGAKLVICPAHQLSMEEVGRVLVDYGVTVTFLTTALFHQLVESQPESIAQLKYLIPGGEAMSPTHAVQALQLLREGRGGRLLNGYGPTENTVFTTVYEVKRAEDVAYTVPIGTPIANTEVYVLDRHMQPVLIGVPGELYTGGAGLAKGYLNRPELTAERFVAHPFSQELGAKLYKTGDLVRYLPDGNIEYLGRLDDQVKIRGFRIELGEIETVLAQHEAVQRAVVIAQESATGDKRLVAYVVLHKGYDGARDDLRIYLKEKMPAYMVPAFLIELDSIPVTPNGKVDRRALPKPEQTLGERTDVVRGRTPLEEELRGIWSQVLGMENIGIHDSIFDLGGHSLLFAKLITRMEEVFAVKVPMRSFFVRPTVAQLAEEIVELQGVEQDVQMPSIPLVPVQRAPHMPLSFPQQRMWLVEQVRPDTAVYNLPFALRLHGVLDVGALERSLNEIVRRHEALRATFSQMEGQPVQVIASEMQVSMAFYDVEDRPEDARFAEAMRVVAEEAGRPFDLEKGPLVRFGLVRMHELEHVFVLNLHHIVADGWSIEILARELGALYEQAPLTELPVQYADYAVWQREWLQGEVLDSQLAYWKQQLAGELPMLELPTDRPRPAVASHRGAVHRFVLPCELTEDLRAMCQREGVTLYMLLLAAFQTLLHRYTGQDDILVGSPTANRAAREAEGLIGFFVNMLVMRTDFSGELTFRELLGQVRDVALAALANQDVPFEKLVEELQTDRDMSYSPLFQVLFQVHQEEAFRLHGLHVENLEVTNGTAKTDLSLPIFEVGDELVGRLEYSTDLFDEGTIAAMVVHFQTLLAAIVERPDEKIALLPLMTSAELEQV